VSGSKPAPRTVMIVPALALLLAPVPQSAAPHAHPGQAEHTHPAPPADGAWVYYDYVDDEGRLAGGRARLDDVGSIDGAPSVAVAEGGVATLYQGGPSENRLDVVFVGDGYTAAQLGAYASHVGDVWPAFFAQQPLADYKTYFNVHRVDVVSNQSGVDNDPVQGVMKDTALDMEYWCNGIDRLLCVNVGKAYAHASQAPDRDQVLALANSTTYGGAGYPANDLATLAGNNGASIEIGLHELGHSLGDLADEYDYGGPATYGGAEPAQPNVSIHDATEIAALGVKWNLWLGSPGVSAFQGAMYSKFGIYRPTNNSKMRSLGQPFHAVNAEQLVARLYDVVDPIDGATPAGTYTAGIALFVDPIEPVAHALDTTWLVDGSPLASATGTTLDTGALGLGPGIHTVTARVVDNTDYVRDEALRAASMTEERSWQIAVPSDPQPPLVAGVTGDGWLTTAGPFFVSGAFLDVATAARIGGAPANILGGGFETLTLQAPAGLTPGAKDVELDWSGGTVTLADALVIGPTLAAETTGVGGTLTVGLDLHKPIDGTFTLAAAGAVLPAPVAIAGIHHGLLLDPTAALVVLDSQTFTESTEVVYPVPSLASLTGKTLHLQAHVFAWIVPLPQAFSSTAAATF